MAVTDQITKIEKITMITKQQHKTLWFFVVIVVSAIGGTLLGQQQDVIRTGVTMVPIDVRAFDRQGRPVTNLKAEDFTIYEDGVPQKIARVELDLTDATYQKFTAGGIPHTATLPAPPELDAVKVVVYDYAADLVGSLMLKVR